MESQDIAIGIVVSVVLGVLLVLILKKIADSKWFMETLHIMCSKGDIWYVKRHLDKGSDVNAKDENGATPQDLAIQFKEFETAALLRKHGGKHETIHSADVSDEDGSRHRNFVYWFLWFILGVMSLAIFIYIFVD